MIHRNILSELSKPWMIDANTASQYIPMIKAYFETGSFPVQENIDYSELRLENKMFAFNVISASKMNFSDATPNSIAVIPVKGLLMKNDGMCSKGTNTMRQEIKDADANDNISAIILDIDSGGGSVDGTEAFAEAVKNTSKPVVTYVNGTIGSAAYWIGSQANEIILGGKTASAGSIGTMITMADMKPMLTKAGVNFHNVRATESVDKNEAFYQMLDGNYEPLKEQILDPLNKVFLDSVRDARAGKLSKTENVLTGKMYVGESAVSNGLVDSIGTFEQAVQRADELAKEQKPKIKNQNKNLDMNFKEQLSALSDKISALALKITDASAKDDTIDVTAVSAEINDLKTQMTDALADAENAESIQAAFDEFKTSAETQISDLTDAKATIETELVDANTLIDDLKAQNLILSGGGSDDDGDAGTGGPNSKKKNDDLEDVPLTDDQIRQRNVRLLSSGESDEE